MTTLADIETGIALRADRFRAMSATELYRWGAERGLFDTKDRQEAYFAALRAVGVDWLAGVRDPPLTAIEAERKLSGR
jgi:hypothetical protein